MRTLTHANKTRNIFAYLSNVRGRDILVLCQVYPRITFGYFSNVRGKDKIEHIYSHPADVSETRKSKFFAKGTLFSFVFKKEY